MPIDKISKFLLFNLIIEVYIFFIKLLKSEFYFVLKEVFEMQLPPLLINPILVMVPPMSIPTTTLFIFVKI